MEIAISPAIAQGSPEPAVAEPISPELVLVDPELRRALQAQALARPPLQVVPDEEPLLREPSRPLKAPVATPAEPEPPAVLWTVPPLLAEPEVPQPEAQGALAWVRRRVVPTLLPISLALNAILIAFVISDATARQSSSSPPPLTTALPSAGSQQKPAPKPDRHRRQSGKGSTHKAPTHKSPAPKTRTAKARTSQVPHRRASAAGVVSNVVIERKLLTLIVQSPAGKLPRALIDPKTGLAKNNLQAVCRRENGSRSFLCVVQPAQHKSGEGLYVRYRLNRKRHGRHLCLVSLPKRVRAIPGEQDRPAECD